MTQDGYDWPNGVGDERWPVAPEIKRKPPEIKFRDGQVWRCRGGGEWELIGFDATKGGWIARGRNDGGWGMYWRYEDNGRPFGMPPDGWGAMDLIELVA